MGSSLSIDAKANPTLRAAILAMKSIDRALAKQIRQHVKEIGQPEWQKAVQSRTRGRIEDRVLGQTATISVSNQNVSLRAASKGRPLRGGLDPKLDYAPVEHGASPGKRLEYRRVSRKGYSYRVRRKLGGAFARPRREGPFYQAAVELVPRVAAMFVQTAVRTIANALKGEDES